MSQHSAEHPDRPDPSSAAPSATTISGPIKVILGVLVFTAFVMMVNETTLAVSLPSIMADFSIAAVTPSFGLLLAARLAQGAGTAVILPLLMTVAMTLVPAPRRGAVMGLIAVVMAVGPAIGPTVAGAILGFTSWHGIFWCMIPLVAGAGVLGAVRLTNVTEPRPVPLDPLSVVLSPLAFGGLVYGLSSIGVILDGGPGARTPLVILGIGVVAVVLFIRRQLARGRDDEALLDLRPLGVRNFALSVVVVVALMGAMLGVVNTLPLYLQGSLLVSALVSGLVMLPGGLLEGVLSPIAGRLYDRFGPRPLIIPGVLLITGSLFLLSTIDESTALGTVIALHVVFCIGLAASFSPLMTTALGSLPTHLYGHGSAILNTLQQLAGAAGTAGLITVCSEVSEAARAGGASEPAALADGTSSAFLTAAVVALAASAVSLFITRAPGADSGQPETVVETTAQPAAEAKSRSGAHRAPEAGGRQS